MGDMIGSIPSIPENQKPNQLQHCESCCRSYNLEDKTPNYTGEFCFTFSSMPWLVNLHLAMCFSRLDFGILWVSFTGQFTRIELVCTEANKRAKIRSCQYLMEVDDLHSTSQQWCSQPLTSANQERCYLCLHASSLKISPNFMQWRAKQISLIEDIGSTHKPLETVLPLSTSVLRVFPQFASETLW